MYVITLPERRYLCSELQVSLVWLPLQKGFYGEFCEKGNWYSDRGPRLS